MIVTSYPSLERQTGARLRELGRYVQAMGGELEITARFPDGEIRLDQWSRRVEAREAERS